MMAFCVLFKSIFRNCADMCLVGCQGLKNLVQRGSEKPASSRIVPIGFSAPMAVRAELWPAMVPSAG